MVKDFCYSNIDILDSHLMSNYEAKNLLKNFDVPYVGTELDLELGAALLLAMCSDSDFCSIAA